MGEKSPRSKEVGSQKLPISRMSSAPSPEMAPLASRDARTEPPAASHSTMTVLEAIQADDDEPAPSAGRPVEPRLSFEELYVSSYQSLVRLAFVLTGSREVSEDVVQDCFIRLHRHYHRLESPDRYAKQAVVNACRSYFRKTLRERDKRPLLYVVDGSDGVHAGELHDVLLSLPYRQRAAIVLRYYGDLSEVEIGEILGCRPGTVGSLIHRGLERLRLLVER
jgi:RNA polymerase sigma factor (sigma-70 family)